jgi:demethylmenaquinone methyltransferase/2-methoxy-6-polyprenyl-1,4-benzoquinol methylase
LKRMFDTVPARYDLLNRLLTLRFDERWRRLAARRCLEGNPTRVLDLCCGTGDLALHVARQAEPGVEITALDYSAPMLELAANKAARAGLAGRLRFIEGDAVALPLPDAHFAAVGVAFAFRNLTWRNLLREQVLAEVLRVLAPAGRLVIVETSQPAAPLLRAAFHAYLRAVVVPLGTSLSAHKRAYRYLAESARGFFGADDVSAMLSDAGFARVAYTRLLGGVAAIHVARKQH